MRLEGKVAIVTGGANGIGEATVRDMVNEGAKVIIADIDDEKGKALAEEFNKDGKKAAYCNTDVTKEAEVEAMVKLAKDEFGKLDILFSNAGIGNLVPTAELELENWQRVIDINLTGVFLSAKHAIPVMLETGGGSIINAASMLGHVGQAETAAYTASKGGVVNMTRALAVEYAKDGIRVNAVCPGYVNTSLLDQLDEEMINHLISLHPINRLAEPEEIAKVTTFLASDDASFITGANLLVDGGYTAV